MSELQVRKVAILGAGVMGAQIAAHFTNLGYPVLLYDLTSNDPDRSARAKRGISQLTTLRPPPLGVASGASWIEALNYDDDLSRLSECDLIIEAIAERMELKQALYDKVTPHLNRSAILASNTSGLSLNELSRQLPEAVRSRFCGVHFFNPPRYMSLVELIPSSETLSSVMDDLETFLTRRMGKRIIRAMDTPNFVANRVGVLNLLFTLQEAQKFGLDCDVVDDLTGTRLGRPRSATYRTADVVGLDTLVHVVETLERGLENDPCLALYQVPETVRALVSAGALGAKTGAGFYKKMNRDIFRMNFVTGEYVPANGTAAPEVSKILEQPLHERFASLRNSSHPQARFLWAIHRDLFQYCAIYLDRIAHCARDVDMALRWGYGWREGPFELWQQAGWSKVARWIEEDRLAGDVLVPLPLPDWALDGREEVHTRHGSWNASRHAWHKPAPLPVYARQWFPEHVYGEEAATALQAGTTVHEDPFVRGWTVDGKSLIATLKTKMRTFNTGALEGMGRLLDLAEKEFSSLVIWGPGEPFSAGGDLQGFLRLFSQKGMQGFLAEQQMFQNLMQRLRHASIPSVAAIQGFALGGGCELLLHCTRRVAHFESRIGLVDAGIGLLPGAGGLTWLARTAGEKAAAAGVSLDVAGELKEAFSLLMKASVSNSATEAIAMGWLESACDVIVPHPDELLHVALVQANALAESSYQPPRALPFPVAGREGWSTLMAGLVNFHAAGYLTDHDMVVGSAIAQVLCGGDNHAGTLLTEHELLALEQKHFCALMETVKTRERIQSFLETGKPLRN